jgi:PGF-pre-PGF domain-containing protein
VEIPLIDPDVPQDVTVENTNITGLTIDTLVAVENVRIVVQQLTDRPATIAIGPPGIAYQYFNIIAENLSDAQIENVTIRFRVEKSWIAQNGIDIQTIALNRYDPATGDWTPLPTMFLSEDDTYAYFSAVSPGLSVFGISGLPTTTTTPPPTTTTTTPPPTTTTTTTPPPTTTTTTPPPTTTTTTTAPPTPFPSELAVLIVGVVILAIIMILGFLRLPPFQKPRK